MLIAVLLLPLLLLLLLLLLSTWNQLVQTNSRVQVTLAVPMKAR
jgi:hypothetical protein